LPEKLTPSQPDLQNTIGNTKRRKKQLLTSNSAYFHLLKAPKLPFFGLFWG
jgi:hypothetical protein